MPIENFYSVLSFILSVLLSFFPSLFACLLRQVDEWVNVFLILIPVLFLYVVYADA